ncbi:hypothetical protein G4B88_006300 [Cannabis sativa]|uniref:Copine C-terminal domain-containing protein n=1 Tax=Cannabis sativa TaxID=3483 RepID=A0A7J6IBF9_CANSA|nr:hypothetical protein G4B88_006300 [Cannabis sativa]
MTWEKKVPINCKVNSQYNIRQNVVKVTSALAHAGLESSNLIQCQSFGKTLSAFDEDNLIPCYGFGDVNLCDCFPPYLAAGTTSFVPEIEMHMTIVEQSHGQYHVLLIIADGQVTRSVDTRNGKLSSQEQKTIDAIAPQQPALQPQDAHTLQRYPSLTWAQK